MMSDPTLIEYFRSSEVRPLPIKRRPDLIVYPRIRRGQTLYIIKNTLTLGLSRLQAEEYWILQQLDGKRSLLAIKEGFDAKFQGKRCDIRRLERLVRYFYQCGLVIACTVGQGELIFQRRQREANARVWGVFSSWTAIRIKGVNPDPILNAIVHSFSKNVFLYMCVVAGLTIATTLIFAMINFRTIWFRFPQIQELLDWNSLMILYFAVILIMRIFHEIGHALTCKVFGGECHELVLSSFSSFLVCTVMLAIHGPSIIVGNALLFQRPDRGGLLGRVLRILGVVVI